MRARHRSGTGRRAPVKPWSPPGRMPPEAPPGVAQQVGDGSVRLCVGVGRIQGDNESGESTRPTNVGQHHDAPSLADPDNDDPGDPDRALLDNPTGEGGQLAFEGFK